MDSLLDTKDDNFNYFQTGKVRLCIKCINCMYTLLLNAVAIKIQFLNFKIDFVCPYFFISIIDADF
jgi:hypothetical protein